MSGTTPVIPEGKTVARGHENVPKDDQREPLPLSLRLVQPRGRDCGARREGVAVRHPQDWVAEEFAQAHEMGLCGHRRADVE